MGGPPDLAGKNLILARRLAWVAAGIGGVILAGWLAGVPLWRSWLPHQVEAKANAAVCFVLLGTALGLKARGDRARPGAANFCAGLATLVAGITLAEYAFDWNPGLDELLVRESRDGVGVVHPGRMTLPASFSVLLLGAAALALRVPRTRAVMPWLTLPAMLVAGLAFLGHLYDLPVLATLMVFTPIAAPAGIALVLLGAGFLLADGGWLVLRFYRFGRMIGFVFALALLFLMAGAVLQNTRALVRNHERVSHTHEVLDKLAAIFATMQEVETAARGYVLAGDPAYLEHFEPAIASAGRLQQELRALTADNPAQQTRLASLAAAIDDKVAIAHRQVGLRQQGDLPGAHEAVANGQGKQAMSDIRRIVDDLRAEETRLLRERQARVEASTQRTLLTLGSGLAISVSVLVAIFIVLRREIDRRLRSEADLRRSEENLAVTLNSIGDAVLATDTGGRVTRLNRVAEQLTGWTRDEARGRPIADVFRIVHEETRAPAPVPVADVIATGEARELADRTALIARDGTERSIADSAAPIRDAGGRVIGVVLVFRDVTAARAARLALRESEERYRTLFNSIDEGFCIIEMIFDDQGNPVDYRFIDVNRSFEKQTGLHEAQGRRMREIAPQHEAYWFETYGRVAVTGQPTRFQSRAEQLHRSYDVYAFRFGAPEKRQVAILFSDITERQRAQAELDRFFHLSLDFLCIAGLDGRFKRVSPAVTDVLGWTVDEFLARPYMEQIHPDDRAASAREIERQAAGHKVMQFENRFQHRDGSWRVLSWRSVPHGGLMYATARDVTESKRKEAEIQRLHADLQRHAAQMESANKELEAFSYSVSHDLRAPLRHVQGYVEMLARETQDKLSDKAQRYLKTITDAARDMGQLIDDLLGFSRMGRSEMREATVDLDALVAEVRRGLEEAAPGRAIEWRIGPLPRVQGDAAMLRQVLVNLLGNAVKYTRRREVAEIEVGAAGEESGRTVFFVRDNGAGFDMKYSDKLFGVFQRLHRVDEFEGTGIGLANVRRIITRHGGRIWAEARPDAGATFYFTLTPALANQPSQPVLPPKSS